MSATATAAMSAPMIERARFSLAPGKGEADLVAASDRFQAFLAGQPGFLRRELLRRADGGYGDLVLWDSPAAAEAMMRRAMSGTSEACNAHFAVMDLADETTGAVEHLDRLAAHARP
jgi:hypothetical protein